MKRVNLSTKSLRFRLTAGIALVFVVVFCAGAVIVLHNARRAVSEEVRSTANLAQQLLAAGLEGRDEKEQIERLTRRLQALNVTKHLNINLGSGNPHSSIPGIDNERAGAPEWFTFLVSPKELEIRRDLNLARGGGDAIIIRADPADEIAEAWKETRVLLGLFSLLFLAACGLVYFIVRRSLTPVQTIATGLESIERGDYHLRLPSMEIDELSQISHKFNHMAAVLEQSRDQNRHLAQRLLAVQEDERRILARELHDQMGQSLSAIMAMAVSIGQRSTDALIADRADTITKAAAQAYAVARGMMHRLRPVSLEELGLVPVLKQTIEDWNHHHGSASCGLSVSGDFNGLRYETAIHIYRIVQECLTNVARHACADRVDIALARSEQPDGAMIQLSVNDNGVGFDTSAVGTGLGLLGMRERTQALRGRFNLTAAPGKGVRVNVTIPLGAADEN